VWQREQDRIYLKKTNDIDASGNVKFGDIGVYIQQEV
jgi:hypothetical protein